MLVSESVTYLCKYDVLVVDVQKTKRYAATPGVRVEIRPAMQAPLTQEERDALADSF